MKLAFHSATTMTCDLETDVAVTAGAGFKALEVWAAKLDRYLAAHSLADLSALFRDHGVMPLAINSIEFIAFRGSEYPLIEARLHELGRIAQAIGCQPLSSCPAPHRTEMFPGST